MQADAWLDSAIAGKVLKLYSKTAPAAYEGKHSEPEKLPSAVRAPESSAVAPAQSERKPFEPDRPYAEPLSPRELEVLTLIVDGLSNQQISIGSLFLCRQQKRMFETF